MASHLYPGESLDYIAGFPTLYHYQPSAHNETKALIVCVPGSLHLARIFYGGHAGSKPSDFISHWLSEHDFGVLSLSYPLETEPLVMPLTGARMTVPEWGRQAATMAKQVVAQNNLPTSVILISWSMGGRMIVPFNVAARELGLNVQQYISFAATPGFSSSRPRASDMQCTTAGYLQVSSLLEVFHSQLAEMERLNGDQKVIPRDIYLREYVGGTPIRLTALGLKYSGSVHKGFVKDGLSSEEQTEVMDFANLPFITAIYPTGVLDARHAITDQATWGFLLTQKLESMVRKRGLQFANDELKWEALLELVHSGAARLCLPVEGNHFFFVGEKSARRAANLVVGLIDRASEFQGRLSELLA